ncbi:MAG: YaiO family outer membrane beta-barrel protein [Burkholderiales bacterium]|jgi:YaiO family outer membrane protein|nr:YaiO family outer membrane beta-barrel protein [Burkholderiales bacterium]
MTQTHLQRLLRTAISLAIACAAVEATAAVEVLNQTKESKQTNETTQVVESKEEAAEPVVALQETTSTTAATDASVSNISANNPKGLRGIETYIAYNRLNAGYKQWREIGIRGLYERGRHLIYAEAAAINRFNESGNYVAVGDTITLNDDWYTALTLGLGSGANFLPDYRIDGFINRKFLADRSLIGTLGLGYSKIPDGHTNSLQSIGVTYYFNAPWVVQGGVTRTTSNPGDVQTTQQFVAATWGQQKQTLVTGRYGWGREGWLALGDSNFVSNFSSHQASISMRKWLGPQWGTNVGYEQYKNPFYTRKGLNLSIFWEL